jgi:hypothetical protein
MGARNVNRESPGYRVENRPCALTGENGTELESTGFGDAKLEGEITGNSVVLAGEKNEDKGITMTTLSLTADDTGTRMDGFEDWSKSDGSKSCPVGKSTLKATKVGT